MTLRIAAFGLISAAFVFGQGSDPARAEGNRVVREGVVVDFSVAPSAPMEREDVEVTFRIRDEATGAPVTAQYPGAWMDVGQSLQARGASNTPPLACKDRIGLYLKNIVGIRPMLDLNGYFLVVLNREPSISVIDPRVGITGRTNLYARVVLKEPGADWTQNRDHTRLYVSLPQSGQVAVVSAESFKLIANVDAGAKPLRVALQEDEKYLWAGNDSPDPQHSGVTAIDAAAMTVAARIPTGRGHHEIVFSAGDRYVFVSNRDAGTVSVIDTAQLKKVKDVATGPQPISLAYSPLSRAVYVADGREGVLSVLDSERHEILARIPIKPGLGPLRFTPDGRWGFVTNSLENAVYIVDAATNRLAYTVPVGAEPYQVTFTRAFAHIRSLGTERVSLINLAFLGTDSMPAPNTFAAGASAPKLAPELGVAGAVAASPKEAAVYVVSPADNAIYYYMEGMNAPSGSFQNYGHNARAVAVIDRSLREREPGVYSARVRLPAAGVYDVAFLLDSPRLATCFAFTAKPNPEVTRRAALPRIEYLTKERQIAAGAEARFSFRLTDSESGQPRAGLADVTLMYYMVPGLHRTVVPAKEISGGVYEARLTLPEPGAYYVFVGSPSLGLRHGVLPFRSLTAVVPERPPAEQGQK